MNVVATVSGVPSVTVCAGQLTTKLLSDCAPEVKNKLLLTEEELIESVDVFAPVMVPLAEELVNTAGPLIVRAIAEMRRMPLVCVNVPPIVTLVLNLSVTAAGLLKVKLFNVCAPVVINIPLVIVVAEIKRLDEVDPVIVPLAAVVAKVAVPDNVSVLLLIFTVPVVWVYAPETVRFVPSVSVCPELFNVRLLSV